MEHIGTQELISNRLLRYNFNNGITPHSSIIRKKDKKIADYVGKEFEFKINGKVFKLIPINHPSPLNPKGYKGNVPTFEHVKGLV